MVKTLRWRVAQYFEALWWKKYLLKKDVNTYLIWKKDYWNNIISLLKASVQIRPEQEILDAGCGPAGIFIVLDRCSVTAVDPLLDTYNKTLPHFKPEMYPNVSFETSSLESFSIDKKFDVVFCMNAINHVSELDRAFLTLYEHTKSGGKIVISIDAHNHKFFKYLFKAQPGDILHPHQYDLAEYKEMLTRLGCDIVQVELIKKEFLFNHYILVAKKH